MSDSDDDVSHVFDQTNGVIAASGGEADGALSGRTTADVEDPTGSKVAGSAPPAGDRDDDRERDDRREGSDDRDGAPAATAGAVAATTERDEDRPASRDEPAATERSPERSTEGASARDEEHTYAVDARGTATDEGATPQQEADGYSGAPAVAALSAADDGRDEGSTRAESSTHPVDDASHTGRLADAYDAGPAAEADRSAAEADRGTGSSTAAAYATGPARETDARDDDAVDRDDAALRQDDRTDRGGDGSLSPLEDGSIGHVFDQTNGVIDGAAGESDGTADGDTASRADRGL